LDILLFRRGNFFHGRDWNIRSGKNSCQVVSLLPTGNKLHFVAASRKEKKAPSPMAVACRAVTGTNGHLRLRHAR